MDVIALSHVYTYKSELTSATRNFYQEHKNLPSDCYPFIIFIPTKKSKFLGVERLSQIVYYIFYHFGETFCINI